MADLHENVEEQVPEFKGATLNVDNMEMPDVDFQEPNIARNRPYSTSTVSRKTVSSVSSKTSRSPHMSQTTYSVGTFFSYRPGAYEKAVEDIKTKLLKEEVDGEIKGTWLLTEIDHWDCEYEKIVILSEFSLIDVRYDFVSQKVYKFFKIALQNITHIEIGNFVYPPKSFMAPREHGGVRVHFGKEFATMAQRWNPFSSTLPFFTFSHHPLIYYKEEMETATYNVDDFHETLLMVTKDAQRAKHVETELIITEGTIEIESYISLPAMVHNQSMLGFSKERGGVSY